MADIKYSQLGAATTITDTDVLPMVNMSADPIETNKITAAKVKEYVIGNTDISGIGNGTATGAISALKNGKTEGTAISEHVETIGSTAVGDYAIGETFLANNGNYYEATAAITGGSTTLTVGTNCKLSTVDEQLNSLKEALTNEVVTRTINGAHNLLRNTLTTRVSGGITFTVSEDGTFTTSGTNNGQYNVAEYIMDSFVPPVSGDYVLSGCPSGGSEQTYYISVIDINTATYLQSDIGEGVTLALDASHSYRFRVNIAVGATSPSAKWSPMLRLASDADSTYQPYAMTNRELTNWTAYASITPTQSGINTIKYRKLGNLAELIVRNGTVTANDWTSIASLPGEIVPPETVVEAGSDGLNVRVDSNNKDIRIKATTQYGDCHILYGL